MVSASKSLVAKYRVKSQVLETTHRWEDNINLDLKLWEHDDWVSVTENRV
jgi:hypothetical protein